MQDYKPGPKIEEILNNQDINRPKTLKEKAKKTGEYTLILGTSAGVGAALGDIIWKIASYNLY